MGMTFQDLFDKGVSVARETGVIIKNALSTLYAKDNEVIGKYVLILAIAGLLIFGLRLLSGEVEEYRSREGNESRKLPWYLRYWTLFLGIIFLYTVIIVLILI
jgi:ABC-type Fe3+ transport system permease subunit